MKNYILIPNQRNVTVKITRGELCRLMLACTTLANDSDMESSGFRQGELWRDLHDKLEEQLNRHDKAYREEYKI